MTFKVTKAKDRAAMAAIVRDIFATSTNVRDLTVEADGSNSIAPRRTTVEFTHGRGIALNVEFDGDSQLDREGVFCMPFHTIVDTDACLSDAFGAVVGGSINPHHFGKCTVFAQGFDELCETLRKAVASMDSGHAYDADREAAKVAKDGTWQSRAERWERWRQDWAAENAAKKAAAA